MGSGRVYSCAVPHLVIVESPGKTRKINAILGRGLRRPRFVRPCAGPAGRAGRRAVDAEGAVMRFDDRAEAAALASHLGTVPVTLDDVASTDALQHPKPPFTTSTLQQAASSLLKLSVSDTMVLAQKLYEASRITYMRTDAVDHPLPGHAVQQTARRALLGRSGPRSVAIGGRAEGLDIQGDAVGAELRLRFGQRAEHGDRAACIRGQLRRAPVVDAQHHQGGVESG